MKRVSFVAFGDIILNILAIYFLIHYFCHITDKSPKQALYLLEILGVTLMYSKINEVITIRINHDIERNTWRTCWT